MTSEVHPSHRRVKAAMRMREVKLGRLSIFTRIDRFLRAELASHQYYFIILTLKCRGKYGSIIQRATKGWQEMLG